MRHVKKVVKAHAGQAKSAPRKRLRQLQKRIAAGNYAQKQQNVVTAVIRVQGLESWLDALPPLIAIKPAYARYFGGTNVSALTYLRVNSDMSRVSIERTILSELLTLGYELQELEVQFDSVERSKWGRCVWMKEHPSYHAPTEGMKKLFPHASADTFSLVAAMFSTQYAGEQQFGLLSTQMIGGALVGLLPEVLLHKALIFRRAVLSAPMPKPALAQAA